MLVLPVSAALGIAICIVAVAGTVHCTVQYSTGPVRGAGPEPVVPRTPSSGHRGSVSGRPSGVAQ